ncbi:RNA polymerase II-associated protein 3 isoform X1 [Solanum pennellii]|uniref:RNA polymerase II-associated protein 3 isoform X1 n=1 Tax=Solanum pennellii TaxID=28526 RepID=A0ABM1FFM5_SOLPN|nr:RNA polymerase II-associated protein 3 isoform X1 [Solanum pennellii]
MARVPSNHSRDQFQDMQGLLNNLQDWELSLKGKDKKMKSQAGGKETLKEDWSRTSEPLTSPQANGTQQVGKSTSIRNAAGPYSYSKTYNPISHLSSKLISEESNINANSEKELGNECFKQKKFNEAIDCYARSIALSPTAVSYANRAMAYLKIKRFQEAENDCTEALNLDDRYIKAYSRRSTSRKELGKLKESIEDAEVALRLEPRNPEIKKQYGEVKALYEKEILKRVSGATDVSAQGPQKSGKTIKIGPVIQSVSSSSQKVAEVRTIPAKENIRDVPGTAKVEDTHMQINNKDSDASPTVPTLNLAFGTSKKTHKISKKELEESVQELAARAAGLAKTEAAKNIAAPNSAYQFEVSWRGLSGDRNLQTQLLKVTSPAMLPRIFKNALSAPMLMDIVRCIATFFIEDMNLAIRYLEDLTKVPRFDMIIMCLSSTDKSELLKIWEEIFCKGAEEHSATLGALRVSYGLKQ